MSRVTTNLLRGTLELLILKALSDGPRHGYGVLEWMEGALGETVLVEEGTLYPALHRIADKGWIEAEWGLSENKRRAKFYRLTPEGARELEREGDAWRAFMGTVARALALEPAPQRGSSA